jgi:hypothetical protein
MGASLNAGQTSVSATSSARALAERWLVAKPRGQVALALLLPTTVLVALGAAQRLGIAGSLFDFDGEGKPLALWSALVLAAAAALAFLTARLAEQPRPWWALGAIYAYMAIDEAAALHEHIGTDLHVDWQKVIAPVALAGGVAFALVLRRVWRLWQERLLLLAGAAAWLTSQILEHYQSNPQEGRVAGYGFLSGAEETLEVTGSVLFVLGLLGAFRAIRAR